MALTLLVHVAVTVPGSGTPTPTTYRYDEIDLGRRPVELVRTYDPATGRVEAGAVDVEVVSPTFCGAPGRRALPPGPYRARLLDGERVLVDGVVARAEVGHDDAGDDPDAPLRTWVVRIADRALTALEAALEDVNVAQPGFAEALLATGARQIETETTFGTGDVNAHPRTYYDVAAVARLAVERAGATIEAWPSRLVGVEGAYQAGGQTHRLTRAGAVYVTRGEAPIGDAVGAAPEWTGAEAVRVASVWRALELRARYADFPSSAIVASLVPRVDLPDTVAALVALDGAARRPHAEDGEDPADPALAVGYPAPDSDDVSPAGAFPWPASWLRAGNAGDDRLGIDVGARLAHVRVTETVTVTAQGGVYSEDVAVGLPALYAEDEGAAVVLVEPSVPVATGETARVVAHRRLAAGRRHELAANHWWGAHAHRASDADTAAITVDLADAEAAGIDLSALDVGGVVAWDGDAWRVVGLVERVDGGQLDVDLRRPGDVVRGAAPAAERATAPPRVLCSVVKTLGSQPDDSTSLAWLAVCRPAPGLLGDGTSADAPDRYVVEVRSGSAGSYAWSPSSGEEPVADQDDHRQFRARAEYDAEGVVTAYTEGSTDPDGVTDDPPSPD